MRLQLTHEVALAFTLLYWAEMICTDFPKRELKHVARHFIAMATPEAYS